MQSVEVGIKFFVADPSAVALREYIPIFHRWIQRRALDEQLVDVADYGHVHHGPGAILVCHGALYGVDEEQGRLGLLYRRRRDAGGGLLEQLWATTRGALIAADKLMHEPELAGRLQFRADAVEVSLYNRLLAPNTDATFAQVKPMLDALFARLWPNAAVTLTREPDPRARFVTRAHVDSDASAAELLRRVANEAGRD